MKKVNLRLCVIRKLSVFLLCTAIICVSQNNIVNAAYTKGWSTVAKKAIKKKYDPKRVYNAYFGFQQTVSWIFRDPWYMKKTGLNGSSLKKDNVSYNKMLQSSEYGLIETPGKIKDAKITGNGTYVIGVTGLEKSLKGNSDAIISMIYFSTDIPTKAIGKMKISNVRLYIDGKKQNLPLKLYTSLDDDDMKDGLYRVDIVNYYAKTGSGYPSPKIVKPKNSIIIKFKVSGMSKHK